MGKRISGCIDGRFSGSECLHVVLLATLQGGLSFNCPNPSAGLVVSGGSDGIYISTAFTVFKIFVHYLVAISGGWVGFDWPHLSPSSSRRS